MLVSYVKLHARTLKPKKMYYDAAGRKETDAERHTWIHGFGGRGLLTGTCKSRGICLRLFS